MNSDRDQQIVKMRRDGATYRQIACNYGLSAERIRQITSRYEDCEERTRDLQHLSVEMRAPGGLTRRWPSSYLISALGFSRRAAGILIRHFDSEAVETLSLIELLDFILPKEYPANCPTIENIPAFRVRNLAIILHASLVNRLCELEFGEIFRTEINERKAELQKYLEPHGLARYLEK